MKCEIRKQEQKSNGDDGKRAFSLRKAKRPLLEAREFPRGLGREGGHETMGRDLTRHSGCEFTCFTCLRVYASICVYMRVYACVYVYMRVYTCICVCIRVEVRICVYMRVYACICMYMRVYACICVYMLV